MTPEHLDQPVDMTRAGLGTWEGRDLLELHGSSTFTCTVVRSRA